MYQYYSQKLSAEKLKLCYDLALPPVQHYLKSEIDFVVQKINRQSKVLELGCGYGRVLKQISSAASAIFGIDVAIESLRMAYYYLKSEKCCYLSQMDAIKPGLKSQKFDLVFCIQNGISAFHVDKKKLINEAVKLTKPGGTVLFSSYSEKFWNHRLNWFEIQSESGLIGKIDYNETGNGVIKCKDGFMATTFGAEEFKSLAKSCGFSCIISEVARSSIFCEIKK